MCILPATDAPNSLADILPPDIDTASQHIFQLIFIILVVHLELILMTFLLVALRVIVFFPVNKRM